MTTEFKHKRNRKHLSLVLVLSFYSKYTQGFLTRSSTSVSRECRYQLSESNEWTSDFDDFLQDDDGDMPTMSSIFKSRGTRDLSGIQSRQFSLGEDLVLSNFVGKMGFEEVTDWEYYYQNEEDPQDRKVVQPNPFDSEKPKRTRKSSGSVVSFFNFGSPHFEDILTSVLLVHRFEFFVGNSLGVWVVLYGQEDWIIGCW
eukprot:scaffold4637_cov128-Cylindrotheca_fusiformis.AAC.43